MEFALSSTLPTEIWNMIAAISVTTLLMLVVNVRVRTRRFSYCWMCQTNHPLRPPQMSAYDFWWTYCHREGQC